MTIEAPLALREAIQIAPVDPIGNGKIYDYARNRVQLYKLTKSEFGRDYDQLIETVGFNDQDKDALSLYLAATAFTLSAYKFAPDADLSPELTLEEETRIANIHLQSLTSNGARTEEEALEKTWTILFPDAKINPKPQPPANAELSFTGEDGEKLPQLQEFLLHSASELKAKMKDGYRPGIRDIQDLHKAAADFCDRIGYKNPPIWNLTLGNLDWISQKPENTLWDVPYRLGLKGPKQTRIESRTREYTRLLDRAKINRVSYQDPPVGWKAIIDKVEKYMGYFGLDGYQEIGPQGDRGEKIEYRTNGSFLSYGGCDAARRSYIVTRAAIRDEEFAKTHNQDAFKFQPKVLFPTPGFTMIADEARNLGMDTVELVTDPREGFMPTAEKIKQKLSEDKDHAIRILVLTDIGNPNSSIADPEEIHAIYKMLEDYENETGIKITVIHDLAYLGTGDLAANKRIAEAIKTYKRRWDIVPISTKILQEPALRCAGSYTPDEFLADHVTKALRSDSLALTVEMMTKTLATLDFVSVEDILRGAEAYRYRQQKVQEIYRTRPDVFDPDWIYRFGNAALYNLMRFNEDYSVADLIMAGLFLAPDESFVFAGSKVEGNWGRTSVGMTPMTQFTVDRMKNALKNTDFTKLKS